MIFDEKVDFPIKNRVFWHIFVINFDQILVIFHPFLGSFLVILGGYPSPSISALLVVKKCPKLYIYNIGVGWYHQPWPHILCHDATWPMAKVPILGTLKNTDGRTRVTVFTLLWILPDMKYLTKINHAKLLFRFREGRTRVNYTKLPCESPRHFNNLTIGNKLNLRFREGRTKYLCKFYPVNLPDMKRKKHKKT